MPAIKNTIVTERGINATFMPRFREAVTLWRILCTALNSTGKSESYGWLGQLPMVREWLGERQSQAMRDFLITVPNRNWEMTIDIDRNEAKDAQNSSLEMRIKGAATRFAQHPDKLLVDLIEAGETTTCYDSQYFFDTDHAEGDSGTQSNKLTYDASTPTAPTEAEFEAALWQAIKALAGYVDDQGEPWNQFQGLDDMAGIVAFVPIPFMDVASKVMGSAAKVVMDGDTNVMAGRGRVLASARLSWTTKFAIFKVDEPERGFIFQNRQGIETELEDSKKNKYIKHMLDARYAVGYGLWQKAVQTTFN